MYLSGGMSGLSFEEQTKWRSQIKNAILYGGYEYDFKPVFFDPTMKYNFEEKRHKSEHEIFEYDLNALRKSDLVIVNFNRPNSLGTSMELAIAHEHRIPIVGLYEDGGELHPWLIEMTTRICESKEELVEYIVEFFLK